MCAARQGRFWQTHDLLFERQADWAGLRQPRAVLLVLGVRAGADRPQLTACLRARETRTEVEKDARLAARAGARATPSFYIEGGLLAGAPRDADPFRRLLDSVYVARTGGSAPR